MSQRVFCRFCEQEYLSTSLERCTLCRKEGGLVPAEARVGRPSGPAAIDPEPTPPASPDSLMQDFRQIRLGSNLAIPGLLAICGGLYFTIEFGEMLHGLGILLCGVVLLGFGLRILFRKPTTSAAVTGSGTAPGKDVTGGSRQGLEPR